MLADPPQTSTLNPWITIWTRPGETIRQIVNTNPWIHTIPLVVLGGISESIDRANSKHFGDTLPFPELLGLTALLGAGLGLFLLYVGGALVHWTGRSMGGQGTLQGIQAAIAWSNVPKVWLLPLQLAAIALLGRALFMTPTPGADAGPLLTWGSIGLGFAEVLVGLACFIAFLHALAEVQRFSVWKALGNTLLASLVIAAPIVLSLLALTLFMAVPLLR